MDDSTQHEDIISIYKADLRDKTFCGASRLSVMVNKLEYQTHYFWLVSSIFTQYKWPSSNLRFWKTPCLSEPI